MASVRLSEAQWSHILSKSGRNQEPTGDAPVDAGGAKVQPGRSRSVAYIVGLEADAPDTKWTFLQRSIDAIVQSFQPSPVLTHVELVLPPPEEGLPTGTSPDADPHMNFATYLGRKAGWGTTFENAEDFYLGKNFDAWRAIPVVAWDAPQRLRSACETHHVETEYAAWYRLYNYPFSVPPLRSFAWTLDDAPKSPAHCAALTARCLRLALPESDLPNSSAWYGPSTLFLEMGRKARMQSYLKQLNDLGPPLSESEVDANEEDANTGENALLRGSDRDVKELTQLQCHLGTEKIAKKGIEATLRDDPIMARMWQKHLGKSLMKWAHVRGALSDEDMAEFLDERD
ncbi:MAG: hypothetical protein CMK83_01215 [Pseudomonadales bacterium]|nr:hypothetical protein [Pseudomonadales bacterium]|tara:strand:- start:788 stop:1816 length:1029 start_codon:yes stop_codon:yes gene_type:complete